MSTRQTTKTLYSRNGIRIIKTEHLNTWLGKTCQFQTIERIERLENVTFPSNTYEQVKVKCQSPLGFYYYKDKTISRDDMYKKPKSATYKRYTILTDDSKYDLEYPIAYYANGDEQKINIEMRPWDILPGYKGMPDNMINALFKETNKFLDILDEHIKYVELPPSYKSVKQSILFDLFGSEDGPKVQANDIKILAHGFDLKTSFRKRKES